MMQLLLSLCQDIFLAPLTYLLDVISQWWDLMIRLNHWDYIWEHLLCVFMILFFLLIKKRTISKINIWHLKQRIYFMAWICKAFVWLKSKLAQQKISEFYLKFVLLTAQTGPLFLPKVVGLDDMGGVNRGGKMFLKFV